MNKDFWRSSTVAIIGGGSWGTALAHIISQNCGEVRVWVRSDEQARAINSTRSNPKYVSNLKLSDKIKSFSEMERVFDSQVHAVFWVLPSKACRAQAREFAPYLSGSEILIHATKGVEEGSLKRISEVLAEEIPCPRIGVVSGPNLADEIAKGEPAATVVASEFREVIEAGRELLITPMFRVYGASDVVGVEWAGTLKNVLAIAAGCLDALGFGWNARSMLMARGLAEMTRFGVAMGAKVDTFLGLAGVGDLFATCSSPLSRNYRVGFHLAQGKGLKEVLEMLGSVAEGVRTTESVYLYAKSRGIEMPIVESVYEVLHQAVPVREAIEKLMTRPGHERELADVSYSN